MLTWQNKLKEAEHALQRGEVDDAVRLLADSQVRRCAAGQVLAERVVEHIAKRAENRAELGDTSIGWRDLERARAIVGDVSPLACAREKMIELALRNVEKFLQSDDPDSALEKLNKLHERSVAGGDVATLRQVVLKARRAQRLCRFGKFEEAAGQWASAKALRGDLNIFARHEKQCLNQADEGRRLFQRLEHAAARGDWNAALTSADQLLALAPLHPQAREAREEAWAKVHQNLTDAEQLRRTAPWRKANPARGRHGRSPLDPVEREMPLVTGAGKCANPRLLLWVDAVGGYLVCLADEVTLGQAVPGAKVDIPIFGNLMHQHARVRRDGEGYVLLPEGDVRIEGRKLEGPSFLADGDEIQLGEAVRLRFRRPHALSASARLEPLSGHRTQPPADGILLMAHSCVLGPKLNSHVVCRDWRKEVVLFREDGKTHIRYGDEIEIDGQLHADGAGALAANSHVCGEDFSLSVEEV
jgi:hypothetical protein